MNIALIVSTERLWPHDGKDKDGNPYFAFGLNLVTSMVGTPTLTNSDVESLKPWNWDSLTDVTLWASDTVKTQWIAQVTAKNPAVAAVQANLKSTMTTRVNTLRGGNDPNAPFLWDPLNPKGDETASVPLFRHLLGSTATMPSPVAYALNLAFCFYVPVANFLADFIDGNGQLKSGVVLLAAPSYKAGGGAAVPVGTPNPAVPAPPPAQPPTPLLPGSNSPMWVWPYQLSGGLTGSTAVSAYTVPVDISTPVSDPTKSYLDMQHYWIWNGNTFGGDWATNLADKVADAWDLPRLLLDAAPKLIQSNQLLEPQAYWDAISASLHDRANSGWINSPDGAGLLSFAVSRAAQNLPAPPSAEVIAGWIRSLRSQLRQYERANTSLSQWRAAVVETIPDLGVKVFPKLSSGTVTGVSSNGTTLLFTATSTAGLSALEWVLVAGATDPNANSTWQITSLTSSTFTVNSTNTLSGAGVGANCTWTGMDFTPLERIYNSLADNSVLAKLLFALWNSAFSADPDTVTLPCASSLEGFVETAPGESWTTFEDGGTLDLSDGSTWNVTLGEVHSSGRNNSTFTISLNDYTSSVIQSLSLAVTQVLNAGQVFLNFAMSSTVAGASLPASFPQSPLPNATSPYHLRINIQRDTSGAGAIGKNSVFNIQLQVNSSSPPLTSGSWKNVTANPVSVTPGMPLSAVSVTVSNGSAAGGPPLEFAPASAVSVRGSNVGAVITAWDQDPLLNKANSAWQALGSWIHDDFFGNDKTNPETNPGLFPRRRLALGNIGRIWPLLHDAMAAGTDEIDALTTAVIAQLTALFSARLNLAGDYATSPYRDYQPSPDQLTGFKMSTLPISNLIAEHAKELASELASPPVEDDDSPSPNSHAMVFQLDGFESMNDADPSKEALDGDLLRKLSGVGVLMQQAQAPDPTAPPDTTATYSDAWHALNTAQLSGCVSVDFSTTPPTPVYTTISPQVLAPVRVSYRDGVKQPMVVYDNNPLNARSVLSRFAAHKNVGFHPSDQESLDTDFSPFQYDAVTDFSASQWGQLPALKYGQQYQVLPFLIGNCGALPKEIASDNPADLASSNTVKDLAKTLANYLRTVAYRRRVGVGLPRLSEHPSQVFPAYPAGTVPLAREMEFTAITQFSPRARFFYNTGSQTGQLTLGANWTLLVPRVILPGQLPNQPANYVVSFGVQWADSPTTFMAIEATFNRTGGTATAALLVGAATALAPPVTAGPTTVPPLTLPTASQAIDLRLRVDGGTVTLGYRAADRNTGLNDNWQEVTLTFPGAIPPSIASAWVVIDLMNAGVAGSNAIVTCGLPRLIDSSSANGTPAPRNEPPLLIVAPPATDRPELAALPMVKSEVSFNLRVPATDLKTWDRWYAMNIWLTPAASQSAMNTIRQNVWANVFEFAPTGPDTSDQDISIDDPAVSGFVVELAPLLVDPTGPNTNPAAPQQQSIVLPPTTVGNPLSDVQSQEVEFTINVVAVGDPKLDDDRLAVNAQSATITVGEGEIWELRVYPVVANAWFNSSNKPGDQRFYETFAPDCPVVTPPLPLAQIASRLFPSWRTVIEAATPTVILPAIDPLVPAADAQAQALAQAVSIDYGCDTTTWPQPTTVTAILAKNGEFDPRCFRNTARVDLARQVWRWRGRPVDPFPFEAAKAAPDAFPPVTPGTNTFPFPMVWDAEGFGDRSPMDLLESSAGVHISDSSVVLYQEVLTNDPRALYYRVSARAVSRYAPLFPLATSIQMFEPRPGDADQGNAWRRRFVPCRYNPGQPLPRPVVKLVVPLTQAEEGGVLAPGLLAVLDEASFHYGGLAETVEAEIVKAVYVDPKKVATSWPEFGPDPIVSGDAFATGTPPQPRTDSLNLPVVGPVGNTFDTGVDAPRFVASMLVVQAPTVELNGGTLAWYFARVRFRRVLLSEAMSDYALTPTTVPASASNVSTSLAPMNSTSDYAITLADIVADTSADGMLTFRFGNYALTAEFSAKSLDLSFDTVATPTENLATVAYAASGDPRPIRMDLRYIIERDPPPDPNAAAMSWHVSISYRLRDYVQGTLEDEDDNPPPVGVWQTLQSFPWPDASLPTTCSTSWSGANPLPVAGPFKNAAAVSPFTEPVWVQFLPDSNQLIPVDLVSNPSASGIAWVPNSDDPAGARLQFVTWGDDGSPIAADWSLRGAGDIQGVVSDGTTLEVSTDSNVAPSLVGAAVTISGSTCAAAIGTWTIVKVDGKNFTLNIQTPKNTFAGGGTWVTQFSYQVLLTEPIYDVCNRPGQERYLGLYAPEPAAATMYRNLHTSPILKAAGEDIQNVGKVRARIIELQMNAAAANSMIDDNQPPPPGETAWNKLFGPPKASDPSQAADATMRVVRVSQPIDLQRKAASQ